MKGVLDGKVYRPVVAKAWAGMLKHVYADGRLGCIQQTGAEPAPFKPTASYTYGVGGIFAGGERDSTDGRAPASCEDGSYASARRAGVVG